MESDVAWRLPSESRRVRVLLYLSEGVIVGAGILLFTLGFAGAYLVDVRTGSFDPTLTAFGAFTLLLFLFLTLRWMVIKRVNPPTRDKPTLLRDWSETRQWRWVLTVALPVCIFLLGGGTMLWSWWELVFLRSFDLLLLGTVLAGILLYVYVLHKTGM